MCVCTTQILFSKTLTASHTKWMFSTKCNLCRIAIQWFHVSRYSGIPYTKIQPYISRVQFFLCFCMIRNLGSPTICKQHVFSYCSSYQRSLHTLHYAFFPNLRGTAFIYSNTRPSEEYFLVWLLLNAPVNNFSVMFGRSHCFLGIYLPVLWRA